MRKVKDNCETFKKNQILYNTVYSTNKTDRHDITEILLKVTLNAINLNQPSIVYKIFNIGKEPGWLNELGSWIT
jgi:hypothetical protein